MLAIAYIEDKRKKRLYIIKYAIFSMVLIVTPTLIGCATQTPVPQKTQMEIRKFQTRNYDAIDFKMVMKSAMSSLQDDGYIIQQVNFDLGLVTAKKRWSQLINWQEC